VLLDQSAALEPAIEELLMDRGNLLAPAHHRSVKADEQSVVAKRSREFLTVSGTPGIKHALMHSPNLALVGGSFLVSVVAVHGPELPSPWCFNISDNSRWRSILRMS
jgi:hypothetical protein